MDSFAGPTCPHCNAPRSAAAAECPRCGVIYAKARAPYPRSPETEIQPPLRSFDQAQDRVRAGVGGPEIEPPLVETKWEGDAEEAREEFWLRAFAIPAALILARLLAAVPMLRALMRVFLSMWIHELGHSVTAWLCGFGAFPGPWRTLIAEQRSPVVSIVTAGALIFGAYRAWAARRWPWIGLVVGILFIQLVLTLVLPSQRARALITFGGDAGCLVLGSVLMLTVYAGKESAIHRGWLRWGFLVIGAAAFVDSLETWWAARTDFERIPFGEMEGTGLSDPSKLTEVYRWTEQDLIHRYVTVGVACLLTLAAVYALQLWRSRSQLPKQFSAGLPTHRV